MTVLLFFTLFSFLLMVTIENSKLSSQFSKYSRDYYLAHTMIHFLMIDLQQYKYKPKAKEEMNYSEGVLFYHYSNNQLEVEVKLFHSPKLYKKTIYYNQNNK